MNRLKRLGDSRAPCVSPLYSGRVVDLMFLYSLCSSTGKEIESHFYHLYEG